MSNPKYSDRAEIARTRRPWRIGNSKPKCSIDRDTWLARHGQPYSPPRSNRAKSERRKTEFLKSEKALKRLTNAITLNPIWLYPDSEGGAQ